MQACRAADLRGFAIWQGVMNAAHGYVFVLNRHRTSCILRGFPVVHIISAGGHILAIKLIRADFEDSGLVQGVPRADLRRGVLRPEHQGAIVVLGWGNWCGAPQREPLTLEIVPPGGGSLHVRVHDWPPEYQRQLAYTPYCQDFRQSSTLWISPFELVAPAHERFHF